MVVAGPPDNRVAVAAQVGNGLEEHARASQNDEELALGHRLPQRRLQPPPLPPQPPPPPPAARPPPPPGHDPPPPVALEHRQEPVAQRAWIVERRRRELGAFVA